MKKTLFLLIGTRPEVIKMAPVYRALSEMDAFRVCLCTSGQHKSMLQTALEEASLHPDVAFSMQGSLSQMTADGVTKLSHLLAQTAPDAVLVHGDTATAFCGALAAFYAGIPIFHVEAGLRTSTPFSPFPEELYRRVIDTVSTLCFAPTAAARERLLAEGKEENAVLLVGNTVVDGLRESIRPDFSHPLLRENKKTVLLTVHRRENLGAPLARVAHAVRRLAEARQDVSVLFPVHPNPEVGATVSRILAHTEGVSLLPPLGTHLFRNLLARATLVLTDSGGVSEEACALGIPTLVLREETERPEGVEASILFPVGTDEERILCTACAFLDAPPPTAPSDTFGDGKAAPRIGAAIEAYFSQIKETNKTKTGTKAQE